MDTYEKKYKELVGKIEKAYLYAQTDSTKAVLEEIRPELKENEDERIRKELLSFCQNRADNYPNDPKYVNIDKWIAWLEKQGEQKPAEEYNITGIGSKNAQGKLGEMIKNLKHDNEVLEQKPTDKYEGLTDFERTLADICVGWIGEELGWKQYIKDNADVLLKIAIKKFNSVQDVAFEQKPAWSEEDEAHINGIIDYLLDYKLLVYEEDMNVANGVQKELDWLKSLKERYAWKPSDEQIRYLQAVVNEPKNAGAESCHNALAKLLEQLKQLKRL